MWIRVVCGHNDIRKINASKKARIFIVNLFRDFLCENKDVIFERRFDYKGKIFTVQWFGTQIKSFVFSALMNSGAAAAFHASARSCGGKILFDWQVFLQFSHE